MRTLLEPNDIDAEDQQTSLRKLSQTKPMTQKLSIHEKLLLPSTRIQTSQVL